MQAVDFDETIEKIVAQDSRYSMEAYYLSKTDEDTREDFGGGFKFSEALVWPFLPPSKLPQKAKEKAIADADADSVSDESH